jgi:protein TonB
VEVVRGLGHGLDERAAEAVRQWRFHPGTKNGVPVTVGPFKVAVGFRRP